MCDRRKSRVTQMSDTQDMERLTSSIGVSLAQDPLSLTRCPQRKGSVKLPGLHLYIGEAESSPRGSILLRSAKSVVGPDSVANCESHS